MWQRRHEGLPSGRDQCGEGSERGATVNGEVGDGQGDYECDIEIQLTYELLRT